MLLGCGVPAGLIATVASLVVGLIGLLSSVFSPDVVGSPGGSSSGHAAWLPAPPGRAHELGQASPSDGSDFAIYSCSPEGRSWQPRQALTSMLAIKVWACIF